MPTESEEPTSASSAQDAETETPAAVDLDYASGAAPAISVSNAPPGRLDWAVIGVRLTALWCLFSAIPGIFLLPVVFSESRGVRSVPFTYRMATVLPYLAYAIVGIILWLIATSLGRRMLVDVPSMEPADGETSSSGSKASDAQALAFSVAGVVFAALALRHLPSAFEALSNRSQYGDEDFAATRADRFILIQIVVELAIGIGLFLGARGLANVWRRLVSPGRAMAEPAPRSASENDSSQR
jgi:hypothetical protein